jgi:1-acyl-sn-glycerol-3-phosphate acyltransferase
MARFSSPASPTPSPFRPLVADSREVLRAPLSQELGRGAQWALRSVVLATSPLVRIAGGERLAEVPEPALFALNHANSFEAVVAPAAMIWARGGRPLAMLADWMYLELPLLGSFLRLGEPIPVFRKRARFGWREERRQVGLRSSVVERCLATLERGVSVGLFPEGTRNRGVGQLLPARPGLGEIAAASGVPIVPVGISYPAAARLGRVPFAGRIHFSVGASITHEQLDPRSDLPAANQLSSLTMAALAELSGRAAPPSNPSFAPRSSRVSERSAA